MDDNIVEWLLDAQTPTIRYLTLTEVMGCAPEDARVTAERRTIMDEGPVPAILAGQTENGSWAGEHSFYTPKYRSTHWSMMLLAELLVDGEDERFRRGVDFMLGDTADRLQERLTGSEMGWSCLYGNILRYTCHAGLVDDDRTAVLIDYTVRDIANGRCRCAWNDNYACAWGVARTLWGLAAVPESHRTPAVDRAIEQGQEFLLVPGKLPQGDYPAPDDGRVHTLWSRLNFPLFYQADILFTLRVVSDLGALDRPGVQEALDWLESKRLKNGRWRGSSPYRQRTWPQMGGPEETGRWVTMQSLSLITGNG